MRTYPVRVPRSSYRGRNPRDLMKAANHSRVAGRVQDYINSDLASAPDDTVRVFHSHQIALDLAEDSRIISDVVFSIDGGSNGVTIVKGDIDRALARAQVSAPAHQSANSRRG